MVTSWRENDAWVGRLICLSIPHSFPYRLRSGVELLQLLRISLPQKVISVDMTLSLAHKPHGHP